MCAGMDESGAERRVLVVVADESDRDALIETVQSGLDCEVSGVESEESAIEHLSLERADTLVTAVDSLDSKALAMIQDFRNASPDTHLVAVTKARGGFSRVDAILIGADDIVAWENMEDELNAVLVRNFRDRDRMVEQMAEERRYRRLFENFIGGNLMLHQSTSQIIDVNRAFCALTGKSREQILGKTLYDILDENQHDRFKEALSIFERTGQGMVGDIKLHHVDGHCMSVDVSVTYINDPNDPIVHVAFADVTERRRVEEELVFAVQTDSLTGLLNKRSMMSGLDAAFARARNEKIPLSLMFIDLDNFKLCNDLNGHQTGDSLLAAIGEVIKKSIRRGGVGALIALYSIISIVFFGIAGASGKIPRSVGFHLINGRTVIGAISILIAGWAYKLIAFFMVS